MVLWEKIVQLFVLLLQAVATVEELLEVLVDPVVEVMLEILAVLEDLVMIPLDVQLMEPLKEMMVVKEVLLLVKLEVVAVEEQPRVQLVVALVLHKVETVVMV